ncbi:MAG TPA: hypothetical protein PKC69_14180 [Chitinophagaceae bacterium]|nr:hypothetical protein [Chitinophagaceae bacterium]
MKRVVFYLLVAGAVAFTVSSCAATKKDCQGVKHYRLKNGVYL